MKQWDIKYKEFLKEKGCVLAKTAGYQCKGPKDIHHLRRNVGMGARSPDIYEGVGRALCLCRYHHQMYHTMGKKTFAYKYKIDLEELAKEEYKIYKGEQCQEDGSTTTKS